jgi:hypothetical protein
MLYLITLLFLKPVIDFSQRERERKRERERERERERGGRRSERIIKVT